MRLTAAMVLLIGTAAIGYADPAPELPSPPVDQRGWRANGELAELLQKMQKASQASQQVFEKLTAEQLNWRPPNGTHTPRWNAEHVVGRQLLFFSQIYAAIDPQRHQIIDLNPDQMPPDYRARHPEWTGKQEARLMERVSEYVQGHAYLLDGLDLDAKAPGSKWKLRALLKQMERHFGEHTANVEKKFELPGWPEN